MPLSKFTVVTCIRVLEHTARRIVTCEDVHIHSQLSIDRILSRTSIVFFLQQSKSILLNIPGTTDTPCVPHARPEATEREIQFILSEIDSYFDCNIKVAQFTIANVTFVELIFVKHLGSTFL